MQKFRFCFILYHMKKFLTISVTLILFLLFAGCGYAYESTPYINEEIVFGSHALSVTLYGRKSSEAFKKMVEELKAINADISLTESSPIAYLNQTAAGEKVEVVYHTYKLLELSKQYYEETNGAFNIAMQGISALWRVDAKSAAYFAGKPVDFALPSYEEVLAAKAVYTAFFEGETPFGVYAYEENGKYYLVKMADGIKIDFGAVAKGYAADVCADIAKDYQLKSAVIDVARNIKVYGQAYDLTKNKTDCFNITIAAPRPRPMYLGEDVLCAVSIFGGRSVVVSGDYQRFYNFPAIQGEKLPLCHIIDPFTGMPLGISYEEGQYVYKAGGVISAMIDDAESARADAYATAACVLGYEDAKTLLKKNNIKGLVMTEEKIAFMGRTEAELFRTDIFKKYQDYGASNIEFAEYA